MRQPGLTATVAKTRRGFHRSVQPGWHFVNSRWRKLAQREPREVLYNVSRTFLAIIMVLLLACTAIDILPQSFSSGQFWNSIIVIVAMSLIVIWAVLLHLIRRVTVNRWLTALPRSHQLGRRDIGKKLKGRIEDAQKRCRELFLNQRDFAEVRHPGLQNPQVGGAGLSGVLDIGSPFWEIADMLPIFIEDYCTLLIPEFMRPPGASLREYLEMALHGQLLMPDAKTYVDRFLLLYEELRYSGKNLSQNTLLELMEAFTNILNRFQDVGIMRNGNGTSHGSQRTNDDEDDDGGFISLVPSVAVASSQSSYSSSTDSVRIHPTATQDSWASRTSRESSSVSHNTGQRLRDRLRHRGSSLLSLLAFDSGEPVPGMPTRPTFMEDSEHHLLPPRESDG